MIWPLEVIRTTIGDDTGKPVFTMTSEYLNYLKHTSILFFVHVRDKQADELPDWVSYRG